MPNEPTELSTELDAAENAATAEGQRLIQMGRAMIDAHVVVVGSCWDYISALYSRSGFGGKNTVTTFSSKQAGPYAELSQIQAGDWLYFINHSYGDVEHSSVFITWTDLDQKQALMLSYAGGDQALPARFKIYDLSSVYHIMRPKPGSAALLPPLATPTPFMEDIAPTP